MSAASDLYEKQIAENINSIPGMEAARLSVGVEYSDVAITKYNNQTLSKRQWVEVKMSHSDNLSNPRVFYKDNKWQTTYKTPAAKAAVEILNKSQQTKQFIKAISKFSGIPENVIKIPTTYGGLKEPGAVPLMVMKAYFDQPGINRYIVNNPKYPLGDLVTQHYTVGKREPAYYMQAGDDFYLVSRTNPLNLSSDIPLLTGEGDFKMRVSTRSNFYEVQAEIKIISMPISKYSIAPNTRKMNPFI